MKIVIFDISNHVIDTCKEKFKDIPEVECKVAHVSEIKEYFVVTAGNSHGIMGGGIDLAVKDYLGWQIEQAVQDVIKWEHDFLLPVGRLICVPFHTIHANQTAADVQHLIYAPTMEDPGTRIHKEDAYYVACKILRFALDKFTELEPDKQTIAICGLGTGIGGVSAEDFADLMYQAYNEVIVLGK